MKILLTGATGYIAKRLLPVLISGGHEVVCCVRDRRRFDPSQYNSAGIRVIEVDFLKKETLTSIPNDIEAAYYLIHSMASTSGDFEALEKKSAENFVQHVSQTQVKQVIYLSGIVNYEKLSKHLQSRKKVEDILKKGSFHLTTLRSGIIVGSGSASFEIIRDIVEKLPFIVAPRSINSRTQPIAIRNVLHYMKGVLMNEKTFGGSFDIGGPEILTYKDMLLQFAKVRNLRLKIYTIPFCPPQLTSNLLYFITSTSFSLARNLVESMEVEVVCGENNLKNIIPVELIPYKEAVSLAFDKIRQEEVISSWTDAITGSNLEKGISRFINMPTHGCCVCKYSRSITDEDAVFDKIWSIGGKTGWYHANWLWKIRGIIDKLFGGVGLRRGRRSGTSLFPGDSLDFWRVLLADREEKRLLLYAEMRQPGEAWLEFKVSDNILYQTLSFRPLGIWGRIYLLVTYPFLIYILRGMIKKIAGPNPNKKNKRQLCKNPTVDGNKKPDS